MPQSAMPRSAMPRSTTPRNSDKLRHDISLILIMGVLAGCGLIYEYLLSHYAGRILGSVGKQNLKVNDN